MNADADSPATTTAHCKLVLLGEAAVGKSSLVLRFVSNDFQPNKEPTIGAFLTQKCRLGARMIKFEIWDTAGQERFHSLAPMYYRNAQAAVVVFDITKAASLDKAKGWVKELQRQASPGIVIALAGNKLDLDELHDEHQPDPAGPPNARQVSRDEAQAYADQAGLLFFETSAKTSHNVQTLFRAIAETIPEELLRGSVRGKGGPDTPGSTQRRSGRVDLAGSPGRDRTRGPVDGGCAC